GQDCSRNPELLVRSEMTREEIAKAAPGSIIAVISGSNQAARTEEYGSPRLSKEFSVGFLLVATSSRKMARPG
ncbi:MAG: hypothetical protein ACK4NM_06600, partial [Hydrogenophaga sp.]